jgi:predicted small lipoprotein YifL
LKIQSRILKAMTAITLLAALSACGSGGLFGSKSDVNATRQAVRTTGAESVAVNRYLWAASLDVLNFLPVESVDPFTGVIVMGYGTPPGGNRAYRATVYITDPALDARSLNVALQSRNGAVSAETQRAVEDAILSRARQIRIADGAL